MQFMIKIDPLVFKAQFEKAVTTLRWNLKFENNTNSKQDTRSEDVFDSDSKSIDFKYLTATKLPFNKRVYMPPNADVATESKIMFVHEKFNELIEN